LVPLGKTKDADGVWKKLFLVILLITKRIQTQTQRFQILNRRKTFAIYIRKKKR
jgi:hypothetical protein